MQIGSALRQYFCTTRGVSASSSRKSKLQSIPQSPNFPVSSCLRMSGTGLAGFVCDSLVDAQLSASSAIPVRQVENTSLVMQARTHGLDRKVYRARSD